MGTRNLTAVYIDGDYKVAQYGQWDGYPEGQGMTTLTFLRERMNEEIFKRALRNSSYITADELDERWKEVGADDTNLIPWNVAMAMTNTYPELSRDTGAEVLKIVQEHPEGIKLGNSLEFAADSLFCEWAWVIDFDKRTFEAYRGFNKEQPLSPDDRFYFLRDKERDEYHGVVLVAKWSLDELPNDEEFLAAFITKEDEDDADEK